MFISFCTMLIDSTPPATTTFAPSAMTRFAAAAIASRPDAQKRLTVCPGTVTGQPARSADVAADVVSGGAFWQAAAEDHVLDLGRIDAGAFDRVLDRRVPPSSPRRLIERAAKRAADRRARGRNDRRPHACAGDSPSRSLTSSRRLARVPHRAAVMRRKTVTVDVDDVDVAGTQRDALFQEIVAAVDQRVEQAVADFVVASTSRGAMPALRGFLGEKPLDLRIGDRFASFADRFVVFVECRPSSSVRAASSRQAAPGRSCARVPPRPAPFCTCQADIEPREIAHRKRSHRKAEVLHDRVDARRRNALFGQWRSPRAGNRRSSGCR